MRNPADTLKETALRLRNASPSAWDEFLASFKAHTDVVTVAVIGQDPGNILVAQGRAQDAHYLYKLLSECDQGVKPVLKK